MCLCGTENDVKNRYERDKISTYKLYRVKCVYALKLPDVLRTFYLVLSFMSQNYPVLYKYIKCPNCIISAHSFCVHWSPGRKIVGGSPKGERPWVTAVTPPPPSGVGSKQFSLSGSDCVLTLPK